MKLFQFQKRVGWQQTLFIMFFAQSMVSVGFSSIFPFLPLYVNELGTNTSMSLELLAGLVYSAPSFTMMIASPFWGMLADRHGRKMMVERAIFSGAVLLFAMAFVRSAEELVLLRVIQGMLTGVASATYALVAAEVPRERAGFAMGLLQVGQGSGVALGPLIGGAIADVYGYRAAFYITGSMMSLAGLLILVGVHENFRPAAVSKAAASWWVQWQSILALRGVPAVYSLRFLTNLGQMVVYPLIPLFLQTLLPSSDRLNTFTGLVVGASSATMTLSAIALGRLGDRVGHRKIVIISGFAAALFYLPQGWVQTGWQLLALQVLLGAALGGLTPSISALLANYTPHGEEGAVYGLDNSIMSAARSVAPMLGSTVALWFGMRVAFPLSGALYLLLGMLAIVALPKVVLSVEKTFSPADELQSGT